MRNPIIKVLMACTALALPLNQALAVDANVDATGTFRVALTLTPAATLDFSPVTKVEFSGTAAGTDKLIVSTSGVRTTAGTFFTILDATGTPGEVTIAGTTGESVSIGCDTNVDIENGAGHKVTISSMEFDTSAGGVAAGSGTACAGHATPTASALTLTGTDHVLIGGTIVATSGDGLEAGTYTTTAAGAPIVVSVVYM